MSRDTPKGTRRVEHVMELRDVTKSFGTHAAVRGVSLDIRAGEFFSLLGPSGCGKTTLLRLMAGFEQPDSGTITFPGATNDGRPAYARDVNMVFQHYALFPHLTAARNVSFGLEMAEVPAKERHRRVEEALQLVQLEGLGDRMPHELSGGQQQRVALARAFVTHPRVLLLDEPLGALDLRLRQDMQGELKSLQRKLGITFVYVTHDQDEAFAMSDRVAVFVGGRLRQVATPMEIYERPATREVAAFVGEMNLFEGRVESSRKGRVRVTVGATSIDVSAFDDSLAGSVWLFGLRPELIVLEDRPARARTNRLTGRVVSVTYLGVNARCRIEIDRHWHVSVRLPNDGKPLPEAGQPVHLSFRPDDVIQLFADTAE